jgi:hypothetical protein
MSQPNNKGKKTGSDLSEAYQKWAANRGRISPSGSTQWFRCALIPGRLANEATHEEEYGADDQVSGEEEKNRPAHAW